MNLDELLRAFCYFLLFPAYIYFALIAWNRKQYLIAGGYGLLALFFALLMFGLVIQYYYEPMPELLRISTGVVVLLALVVIWRATLTVAAIWRAIGHKSDFRVDSD
jgi:hypothetical protein